jgi:hypothetical protein
VIYEYAIDPALVKDWALKHEVGLARQFGLDQRRVVSDFPLNWEGQIVGALWESFGWDDSSPDYIDANRHLNALLQYMRPAVSRGHRDSLRPWLEQALEAHHTEPFHAILTQVPVDGQAEVITPAVDRELNNPRWHLPTIDLTTKTASALADQLAPLLRMASQIVLVDPYFEADKAGYPEVLSLLIERAISGRSPKRAWPEVTVMTGVGDRERPSSATPVEEQLRREAVHRCSKAEKLLRGWVPKGLKIKFLCIAQFANGDQVHNRLLLTDVGGASIPYGTQALGEAVFDDITPLFAGQYRTRWRQYGKGEGLTVIGSPMTIEGCLTDVSR